MGVFVFSQRLEDCFNACFSWCIDPGRTATSLPVGIIDLFRSTASLATAPTFLLAGIIVGIVVVIIIFFLFLLFFFLKRERIWFWNLTKVREFSLGRGNDALLNKLGKLEFKDRFYDQSVFVSL